MMRIGQNRQSKDRVALFVFGAAAIVCMCGSGVAIAWDVSAEMNSGVEPGASILQNVPWYDAESGSIESVPVRSRTDDSVHRDSRWLPKAKKLPTQSTSTAAGGGPAAPAGTGVGVSVMAWGLILLLIIVLVTLIIFALTKSDIQFGSDDLTTKTSKRDKPDADLIERINELPAELRRTDVNARDEAERLMHAGKFGQAIILLFSHQLLLLDHAGYLRLSRGKTNGRYVREVRPRDPACSAWLRETATAFERSYFGRHQLDADWFDRLWQQNAQLEAAVAQKQEAA